MLRDEYLSNLKDKLAANNIPGIDSMIDFYDEAISDRIEDGMSDWDMCKIIEKGRRLYMDVNDRCGPPYTVVLDDDYEKLCPWASVISSGRVWPDELTDAAVEIFESEKDNREQRRRKRKEREKS